MKLPSSIIDSSRYATADWYNLIILGIIIFLLINLFALPGNAPGIDLYDITVLTIITLLWFLESGYIFPILEETTHGSKNPPKFSKIKEILTHGIKENIIFSINMAVPLILGDWLHLI